MIVGVDLVIVITIGIVLAMAVLNNINVNTWGTIVTAKADADEIKVQAIETCATK